MAHYFFDYDLRSAIDMDEARKSSHTRMRKSYSQMMDSYAKQQESLANRPGWVPTKTRYAKEPDDLTVTHINQTNDLFVSCAFHIFDHL